MRIRKGKKSARLILRVCGFVTGPPVLPENSSAWRFEPESHPFIYWKEHLDRSGEGHESYQFYF